LEKFGEELEGEWINEKVLNQFHSS
jgi:hypothetical protein